jgi:hypothetical protein
LSAVKIHFQIYNNTSALPLETSEGNIDNCPVKLHLPWTTDTLTYPYTLKHLRALRYQEVPEFGHCELKNFGKEVFINNNNNNLE